MLALLGLRDLSDLCSRQREDLPWNDCVALGSDCISLIIWIRTRSLAVLRRLDSSPKDLSSCILSRFSLCAVYCGSSLCSSSRSRRESSRTSRFPHLHECRLRVGRELRLVPVVALASSSPPPSAQRHLAAGTSSQYRCVPGVGFHGATTASFNTSQTKRSGSVFRLIGAALTTAVAVPICQSEIRTI